jgi:hypothetical protein
MVQGWYVPAARRFKKNRGAVPPAFYLSSELGVGANAWFANQEGPDGRCTTLKPKFVAW